MDTLSVAMDTSNKEHNMLLAAAPYFSRTKKSVEATPTLFKKIIYIQKDYSNMGNCG